ncbi:globin domain-containing protein [Thermomonospora amylolytica]|uniref:globin domain-containing protein n=1 Tax=Thermomonospora amylolytica TaxID=1411117 RepID=UPI000E6C881E|nr:globin domain-containing protein [Thermomonospora amylolytica]
MSSDARIVKETFALLEPNADRAVAYFYGRLFAEQPRLRALFPPALDAQRDRVLRVLTRLVWSLEEPAAFEDRLRRLGREHRKLGLCREHYPAVGAALVATLRRFAADAWNPRVEAAWTTVFAAAARTMADAAEADAARTPPWWLGEVVGHERRRHDIAVLTVRPGQPLPYAAGQHVTVQTSRWPRVWRPYSVANAPRPDGALTLHVRAVPAGWVSGALVRHTAVGDTVMLGPAQGDMTLDRAGERDLLLVAGGTGLAPLKALAEQALAADQGRRIDLVWGARTADELYDLPALRTLEAACPALRVIPVTADDPGSGGPHGAVPDALKRLEDLPAADMHAYVCGPAAMVARTVRTLRELGVPPDRIAHDEPDLDAAVAGLGPVAAAGITRS